MNRSSASVNSGVSGGTWDEDLFFCWLPINIENIEFKNIQFQSSFSADAVEGDLEIF